MPEAKLFNGIIGKTYNKLFEPFLPSKDELSIITNEIKSDDKVLENSIKEFIGTNLNVKIPDEVKIDAIKKKLKELK